MTNPTAKVLIVDDRPENLLAVEAILDPLGYELIRANSGPEALRALMRDDFAVILIDVQMPVMNGFEAVEIIKSRERTKHIPVIFLTAISKDDEYVFKGYAVGAVDYMFKPLQADILRMKVAAFVELHLKNQQLRDQEQQLLEATQRDLEHRMTLERMESEARFSEIIASATEAIVMFDQHNRITLFNSGAGKIFGMSAEDAAEESIMTLIHATSRSAFARSIAEAGAPGRRNNDNEHQQAIFTAVRRGGQEFPLECSVSHLREQEGSVYTLIGRDISERVAAEVASRRQAEALAQASEELQAVNDELNERQDQLEEAMGARSRFYASMSHELRTPINAILGYSSLLLEGIYGSLNADQINGIERTNRAANHLLELVNDILDLSKIEAGKFELQIEQITFPSFIEDLFITVRPIAEQAGSELTLVHDGPSTTLITDPRRVRQIVLNLLSNAIKFGNAQPVSVSTTALPDGGIQIDVCDSGDGIALEDQKKIFDEFVQLHKRKEAEGTGLGLPISRRLAQLLNGTLVVKSELHKGSTFTLRLPARVEIPAPIPSRAWNGARVERAPV
ncbi:MAG TPA: ATP-binding protein [Longimicrobiales bacterium]|nr:ATP-binding protein [Longimicrobiales bacterium]